MFSDELIARFKIRKNYSVSKGEYMFAYGSPCLVVDRKYIPEIRTLNIMCRDLFSDKLHCVQLQRTEVLIIFEPERITHRVELRDEFGVLTDTDDSQLARTPLQVDPGDAIVTVAAPYNNNGWRVVRAIEKITPAASVDAAMDETAC